MGTADHPLDNVRANTFTWVGASNRFVFKLKAISLRVALICAAPAILLSTLILLPFLHKPFVVDDPQFLLMSQQILRNPLRPMDFEFCGNVVDHCTKASELMPGNALMGYLLIPVVLAGGQEWMAHATQIVLLWLALVAMAALTLRMGWSRYHATAGPLLLAALPPCLSMASTAMPDVLGLATGLIAMERLAAWKTEGRWGQAVAAAATLALAGFARAHLALMLPLGAFFVMERAGWIRHRLRAVAPIAAGGGLLLLIIAVTTERSLSLTPPSSFRGLANISPNLRAYLMYLCVPLPLAVVWAANRWKTSPMRAGIVTLATISLALSGHTGLALEFLGTCVLLDVFLAAWKGRDREQMFLWLWILIPLSAVYYGHLPIKYLLPCVPAIILLCFGLAAPLPAKLVSYSAAAIFVAGMLFSLVLLRADAELAEFDRDTITALVKSQVQHGATVWIPSEFAANWYAEQAGARTPRPGLAEPKPGDLFLYATKWGGRVTPEQFPKRTLLRRIEHTPRFGTISGLYSNRASFWLWSRAEEYREAIELWRIDGSTVPSSNHGDAKNNLGASRGVAGRSSFP
jgi:hypothetical protein